MTEQGVINIIDKIADKLSVPTTEIVNAYAASGIIDLWITITMFIFATVGILISYLVYKYDIYENKNNRYEKSFSFTRNVIVADVFLWILTLTNIPFVMFWFSNPKAYAILEIIKKLK